MKEIIKKKGLKKYSSSDITLRPKLAKDSEPKAQYFTAKEIEVRKIDSKKFSESILKFITNTPDNKSLVAEREVEYLLPFEWNVPFPKQRNPKFTFIDLFAGIGGFRIAFQNLKGECVFTSEYNKFAQVTYAANFGDVPFGDITKIPEKNIPDHDILLAGIPCQPFSIAEVSKKNDLGVTLPLQTHKAKHRQGGAIRSNLFSLHTIVNAEKRISTSIPNAKQAA